MIGCTSGRPTAPGRRLVWLVPLCLVLQACSWMPFVGKNKPEYERGSIGEFIAKLPDVEVPEGAEMTRPSREDVVDAYREVYNALPGLP